MVYSSGSGLVKAKVVAEYLNFELSWVYAHQDELGVVRCGRGPKPRLRFDMDVVKEFVTQTQLAASSHTAARPPRSRRRRSDRKPRLTDDGDYMLPIVERR
jgi:hypothetical protein